MNKLFVAALKEETVGLDYFYHIGVGKINATYNLTKLIHKYKISRYNFFLSFIKSLKIIDYAIVGMSNEKDFNSLKNSRLTKIKDEDIYNFKINNKKLIDPRFWSL